MKYTIIYSDPPWSYRDKARAGNRGAACKYPVMSLEEIAALPVGGLAADDCLLAMWWVPPMPEEALYVMKAWGFELITMKGFTWHKETAKGKSHFGMGHWTRANTEDCLFARRGRPKVVSRSVRQYISSPRREHSQKPDEARDRLVEMMGDVPRIELFARQRFPGWHAWGNEVESDIIIPVQIG
ncbi:MT-A70 family methyltransferase [Paenibacillus dendritiformis]|uniref:MT-A70 family methyltransferase n=1 Tax=Paenibacillus dendritiformis TaxID=130049 RepID=UPI000DAA5FC5|nr:MT-A70 family methyltransferase [Paenibacillus dendritiformis]PZM62585.1 adenine methylase [Paenibacillus dendritiformis]